MDDLKLLRQFRSGDTGHDPQLARARSALNDAIETETFNLPGAIRRPFPRLGIPRAKVAIVGAAACLLLVSASAISLWLPADQGGPDTAAAALKEVAAVAGEQPAQPAPKEGQYLYTKWISNQMLFVNSGGGRTLLPRSATHEFWVGPDNSGRLDLVIHPSPATEDGGPTEGVSNSDRFDSLGFDDLSDLPTDPDQLERRIVGGDIPATEVPAHSTVGGAQGISTSTFDKARSLFHPQAYAPPEVRKALYEVIARQPGVELLGEITDPVGRPGVGVAFARDGVRRELIFDPDTSDILAQRDVILDPKGEAAKVAAEPGTVSYEAYVFSGVADSLDVTPKVNQLPAAVDQPAGFPEEAP